VVEQPHKAAVLSSRPPRVEALKQVVGCRCRALPLCTAVLTLLVQDSPHHGENAIPQLVGRTNELARVWAELEHVVAPISVENGGEH
jgi:hypothetical protein